MLDMLELLPETYCALSKVLHKRQCFFEKKLKELGSVLQNVLPVTTEVVELYPSIPHQDRLNVYPLSWINKKIKNSY